MNSNWWWSPCFANESATKFVLLVLWTINMLGFFLRTLLMKFKWKYMFHVPPMSLLLHITTLDESDLKITFSYFEKSQDMDGDLDCKIDCENLSTIYFHEHNWWGEEAHEIVWVISQYSTNSGIRFTRQNWCVNVPLDTILLRRIPYWDRMICREGRANNTVKIH